MINIVLDNAIKFSPENETIEISLFKNDNMVLCIKDKGCGIPSEEIPYVFDRFHKSNSSENLQGSGLGLSIAKQIADRHNIKINIESKVMEYTKFMFFL